MVSCNFYGMSVNMNNISINNFDNLCRTCSQTNNLVSIQKNMYLIEMLVTSAQIQIQLNDELPKNICRNCIKDLNQTYSFISKCRTIDAAFRQCLTQHLLKNPTENEIMTDENNDNKLEIMTEENNDKLEIMTEENIDNKLEKLTEEIFIKPEISDIDDYNNEINDSDESSEDSVKMKQLKRQELEGLTKPETNNHCADCNKSFATNAEFVSHLTDCQLSNINEPTEQEGNCNFEFHDMSEDVPLSNLTEKSYLSDGDGLTSPDLKEAAKHVDLNLLPKRSQKIYEEAYRRFMDYCKDKAIATFSENVLITYFDELSKKNKSSTLWATYSMLNATLKVKHKLDLKKYNKLRAFLKGKADGYQPKTSKILEKEQILKFLLDAPDDTYLTTKVALVLGVVGACRCDELLRIKTDDIKDLGNKLLLTIPATNTKKTRSIVISEYLYVDIIKRYAARRPGNLNSARFFFKYANGRASKRLIGIHKFGSMPQEIAAYLKLPDVEDYTGHCFRRTSSAREHWS